MLGKTGINLFGRYMMLPGKPLNFECRPCKVNFITEEQMQKHYEMHRPANTQIASSFIVK